MPQNMSFRIPHWLYCHNVTIHPPWGHRQTLKTAKRLPPQFKHFLYRRGVA